MSSIDSAYRLQVSGAVQTDPGGSSGHYVLRAENVAGAGSGRFELSLFCSHGLAKKVITTNKSVADYDFYNPANILVIDEKYTLQGWVKTVFSQ
ncbi:hypothetical protein ACIGJK_12895 [Pseudomonas iridis]|uniref:hypothetical protein n=1 Tax=Pseudomonas iridis TaxID=2710587 RepID=UPI0037C95B67